MPTSQRGTHERARGASQPYTAPAREMLDPLPDTQFGYEQARHLLWRAGFGGTDEQINALVEMGPERAVSLIVDYESVPAEPDPRDVFDKDIMRPPTEEERRTQRQAARTRDEDALAKIRTQRQQAQRSDRRQIREVQQWWLARMIQTTRPLQEKLALLWHGHFATSYRVTEDSFHMYQQNRLFRANAKDFPALLGGIIRDPAMLRYLNNNQNRKANPNENLAREIMELFSLGEGSYSEQDIKEGARALTGYTYQDDDFVFLRQQHDTGNKRVLGASGPIDGEGFVNAILSHRACAPFIATKLYKHFVADVPPHPDLLEGVHRAAVGSLAREIARRRFDLTDPLKTLFRSRHFYSDAVTGQKIKSPAELVVGATRSLGVPARDLGVLIAGMQQMGQDLFFPPSVKGWDGGRAWINTATMFVRQNTLAYMITGQTQRQRRANPNDLYDPSRSMPNLVDPDRPDDAALAAERLLRLAIGRADASTATVLAQAADDAGGIARSNVLPGMLILITSMPEYQLC